MRGLLIATVLSTTLLSNCSKRIAVLGTWREGFKAGYVQALTFQSWNELYDWAEAGEASIAPPFKLARSTDLSGGRHTYTDTRAAGIRDARISIHQEMNFIGNHNSGDTKHFFDMTIDWIKMQDPDGIVPPGHF